jgi:hypothetical protein
VLMLGGGYTALPKLVVAALFRSTAHRASPNTMPNTSGDLLMVVHTETVRSLSDEDVRI